MKKETICIFIILILCAGLYLIYYFMNPNAFLVNNNTTTTISMENYYIKYSNNYYASYGINNNKYNIIDELDNLYIKEISNISGNSLNIIVSNVDGNKLYANNTEDICNAMISDDYIVNENIIYNYDNSNNNFSYEVISSMTKGSYVAINNLC